MRSTPAIDAKLRERLRKAVDEFAEGNTDSFARLIGYINGGYIRQCLRPVDPRPVRASLIAKINDVPQMKGWFDSLLPPLVAADVRRSDAATTNPKWPFTRISPAEWAELGDLRAVAENAAVIQVRELLQEVRARRKRPGAA